MSENTDNQLINEQSICDQENYVFGFAKRSAETVAFGIGAPTLVLGGVGIYGANLSLATVISPVMGGLEYIGTEKMEFTTTYLKGAVFLNNALRNAYWNLKDQIHVEFCERGI